MEDKNFNCWLNIIEAECNGDNLAGGGDRPLGGKLPDGFDLSSDLIRKGVPATAMTANHGAKGDFRGDFFVVKQIAEVFLHSWAYWAHRF